MNSLVYISSYPFVEKSQVLNCVFNKEIELYVNYYLFDGEPLEPWEVGQLLGGN